MFDQATVEMLAEGVVDTLYMTLVSTFFSYVFGMMMGVVLVICRQDGIKPRPLVYNVLDVVVNLTRSFPFLILMIAVIPVTRLLVGTTIGNNATVVPLVIAAAPFVARLVESSLLEVDSGVVEAAQSMGASTMQIILKVLLPEAAPALLRGCSITAVTLVGYSAMAGIVGGRGLGDIAIRYGYHRYEYGVMLATYCWPVSSRSSRVCLACWSGRLTNGIDNQRTFCGESGKNKIRLNRKI